MIFVGKYVALVVLHHTYDPKSIVPDSGRAVSRENEENPENPLVVDCLFHEDKGLLLCQKNNEAVKKVADWLHSVVWYTKLKKILFFLYSIDILLMAISL